MQSRRRWSWLYSNSLFHFPIPNSQFPIPNSQFPFPISHFPISNSFFPFPFFISRCPVSWTAPFHLPGPFHEPPHMYYVRSTVGRSIQAAPLLLPRGCLLMAPRAASPNANSNPRRCGTKTRHCSRTSKSSDFAHRALRGSHCKDQARAAIPTTAGAVKKKHGKVREDRRKKSWRGRKCNRSEGSEPSVIDIISPCWDAVQNEPWRQAQGSESVRKENRKYQAEARLGHVETNL